MRDEDSAEEFIADNHVFTGGLALGIEAEMIHHSAKRRFRLAVLRALARRRFRSTLRVLRNGESLQRKARRRGPVTVNG